MKDNNSEVSVEEIKGRDLTTFAAKLLVDSFYEKLRKLNESSGLSLLFNFRQTSLDLYKFYQQVTVRGGYHQVTKDKSWGAVASNLNPEGSSLLPDQLQNIYRNLLCPYEQIYYYRSSNKVPTKVGPTSDDTSSSGDSLIYLAKKRKNSPESIICNEKELSSAKKKRGANKSTKSSTGHESTKEESAEKTSVEDEGVQYELKVPKKTRNAYQLFVKEERERLKKIHGKSSLSKTFHGMAIKAWGELPEEERKPYFEESKKDKERFDREMRTYKIVTNTPVPKPQDIPFCTENLEDQEMKTYNEESYYPVPKPRDRPFYKEDLEKPVVNCSKMMWPISGRDYFVAMQPAPEDIHVPNESDIELAIQSMKNEPVNDTVFQINLEEYWSIDLPS